jgi:hypothetical protein
LEATTICLAWPIVSAKTVAQKPSGKVSPPLSVPHALALAVVLTVCVLLAAVESVVLVPSVLTHPNIVSAATVKANGWAARSEHSSFIL